LPKARPEDWQPTQVGGWYRRRAGRQTETQVEELAGRQSWKVDRRRKSRVKRKAELESWSKAQARGQPKSEARGCSRRRKSEVEVQGQGPTIGPRRKSKADGTAEPKGQSKAQAGDRSGGGTREDSSRRKLEAEFGGEAGSWRKAQAGSQAEGTAGELTRGESRRPARRSGPRIQRPYESAVRLEGGTGRLTPRRKSKGQFGRLSWKIG
jgi:hypothetical protein